jgi:hypothetical protein
MRAGPDPHRSAAAALAADDALDVRSDYKYVLAETQSDELATDAMARQYGLSPRAVPARFGPITFGHFKDEIGPKMLNQEAKEQAKKHVRLAKGIECCRC